MALRCYPDRRISGNEHKQHCCPFKMVFKKENKKDIYKLYKFRSEHNHKLTVNLNLIDKNLKGKREERVFKYMSNNRENYYKTMRITA